MQVDRSIHVFLPIKFLAHDHVLAKHAHDQVKLLEVLPFVQLVSLAFCHFPVE